ncbi:hypothetical protein [Planctomycetes bacterium TBK1r]|uniref:Uncharacterized protein n=1 Tax=Stieleria magnilauensis TaxID=2527963 RepID=A0ABX5XZA0_9BACT|nr:hypothetical protein TBK1r_63930 [Planctomycetes bacterium TBK1r]
MFFLNQLVDHKRYVDHERYLDNDSHDDDEHYVVSKSHIVGQFYGYISGEDYCLSDGTIWQITTPIYRIRKKQSPRATVFRKGEQYYMSVRGMGHEVEVEAVYLPPCVLETPIGHFENHELQEQLSIPTLTKRALAKWKWYTAVRDS